MNAGDRTIVRLEQWFYKWLGAAIMACFVSFALAIDNPDAPDPIGEFLIRAKPYEHEIEHATLTTQDYIKAYASYERFLDDELEAVYTRLTAYLEGNEKAALREAQQAWLLYREREFEFIRSNWNRKTFGSSSVISRGDYRATITKDRVLQLLHYLQNY